ncbi:uncharacterized protein [Watersipora subatra]|uniref:uncharacterized protein isoform X2 n=1 Tax=Watersipora subatra TaxID=2589382 RepID=UPI00355AF9C3
MNRRRSVRLLCGSYIFAPEYRSERSPGEPACNMTSFTSYNVPLPLLIVIIAICKPATAATFSDDSRSELANIYGFGELEGVNLDYGNFSNDDQTIHCVKEDRYNPGTFFLSIASGLMKYTPGMPLQRLLGDVSRTFRNTYREGNSSVALFTSILDFVQYNQTKLAIADFLNNCIREYDFETDSVRPLIGACRSSKATHGLWNDGDVIPGNSNFLQGVLSLQYVESKNYFVMCDYLFFQLSVYDVVNDEAKPLLTTQQSWSLANPFSLLLSSDEQKLFIAHAYGLSVYNLQSRELTRLVGESVFVDDLDNRPLVPGPFATATVGAVEHIRWLVPDQVILGHGGTNKALVIVNLMEKKVLASCQGRTGVTTTTTTGSQANCQLSDVIASTVTRSGVVYMSTREHDGNISSPALFKLNTGAPAMNFTMQSDKPTSTAATVSLNKTFLLNQGNQLCERCPVQVSVGDLIEIDRDMGSLSRHPIDFITEDRYNPGTFFYNSLYSVMKFYLNGTIERFLGDPNERKRDYLEGNSTTAKFTMISAVLQYNETIMLVADYINNCVREYNLETDFVRPFIGNCQGANSQLIDMSEGDVKPADTHYMIGTFDIEFLRRNKSLLTLDFGYQKICRYDYTTDTVQLLHPSLKQHIPSPYDLLVNSDETMMYVIHSYAISSVDLQTFEVRLLVGTVADVDTTTDIPFSAGPFSTASIGLAEKLNWLVPDQLIVTTRSKSTQTLLFLDLRGEEIYSACAGNLERPETITGGLDVCELNAPTAIGVTQDYTILIGTLSDGEPGSYKFNSNSSIYMMQANVSQCIFTPATGYEQAIPSMDYYTQCQTITISCPRGMALKADTKNRTCDINSEWNLPLPSCIEVSPEMITSVNPTMGQLAGGTVVTVTGYIPDVGFAVYLQGSGKLPHQIKNQEVSFVMPKQKTLGVFKLTIQLDENVTKIVEFEYKENPVLEETELAETIASGGFNATFLVKNINSSSRYTLTAPLLNTSYECVKDEDRVICDIGSFPDVTTNKEQIYMELISDGVRIAAPYVTVHPDPQFQVGPISLNVSSQLTLSGSMLDVDNLNSYYEIFIELSEAVNIPCIIDEQNIREDKITCQPNIGNKINTLNSEHNPIKIRIGNLLINKGSAVFLLRAKGGNNLSPEEVAIIVSVLVTMVAVIICGALFFFRRYRLRQREENFIRIYREDDEWLVHINIDLKAKLNPLLIEPESLKLKNQEPIGEGNFGKIYLGQLYKDRQVKTVAVKTLKEMDTNITVIEKFLEEAVILEDFHHANVLPTLAVCIPMSDKPQVVLPYMANGDLKALIQMETMKFTLGDLMHFAKQVACGMEYMARNKFVHRDLAARNCLVSDKYIVRIADFGLSRDVYAKDYYRREEDSSVALPVKWLAIESLQTGVFTSQSDVWSYGVLVWELITRGAEPYSDVTGWDVKKYLEYGRRLHQPRCCPPEIYDMMCSCWLEAPTDRTTFAKLHTYLDSILGDTKCTPQSSYSYIRDYTKDISADYVDQPIEVEMKVEDYKEYLRSPPRQQRKLNHYPELKMA